MLDETINECKHEENLMNEMNTNNFGILNHIFENELPTLIKTNKKGVKNVIKTIKEDKSHFEEGYYVFNPGHLNSFFQEVMNYSIIEDPFRD